MLTELVEARTAALRQAQGTAALRTNAGSWRHMPTQVQMRAELVEALIPRPMWQPGALSRTVLAIIWLVLGIAMVAVSVWLGWTRWLAILNGHLAMLIAASPVACWDSLPLRGRSVRWRSEAGKIAKAIRSIRRTERPRRCCGVRIGESSLPFLHWCLRSFWSSSLPTRVPLWRPRPPPRLPVGEWCAAR